MLHTKSGDSNPALDAHQDSEQISFVDSDCCFAIIQALKSSSLETQIFNSVSPAEFSHIISLSPEHKRSKVSVKFVYYTNHHKLIAMMPYEIHEVPINHLSSRIHKLLASLSLDPSTVSCTTHLNLAIWGSTGNSVLVPDFCLDLHTVRPLFTLQIPFWVAECGFSSSQKEMINQLELAASIVTQTDVALMISIQEKKYVAPPRNHLLHSRPPLSHSNFVPAKFPTTKSLPPIIVEGISWIAVKSVTIHMFLHGPNGVLLYARRVLQLVAMMESVHADPLKISHLCTEGKSATFPAEWLSLS